MKSDDRLLFRAKVLRSESLSASFSLVVFERPEGFREAFPGQFISIRVTGSTAPLLRRPYSIMDLDCGGISLLVQAVGPGSRILASARPGDVMEIAGPLGGTWFESPKGEDAVFVAGGTGLAPMVYCARRWKREGSAGRMSLFYGAACSEALLGGICEDDFTEVLCSTMDGSTGFRGDVVSLLEKTLEGGGIAADHLYSCGPRAMVKALELRAGGRFRNHFTSLESVMACGVGACRGCTVPVIPGKGAVYRAVCSDGTVFRAGEIDWEGWKE